MLAVTLVVVVGVDPVRSAAAVVIVAGTAVLAMQLVAVRPRLTSALTRFSQGRTRRSRTPTGCT